MERTGGIRSAILTLMTGQSDAAPSFGLKSFDVAKEKRSKEIWASCIVDCGGRCALRLKVCDGVVTRVETDNTGSDAYGDHQLRACLRGRSMRKRLYSPERLKYPLKRVGERGEGKFERITWDEAFDTIAQRLKQTIDQYGNEAVYIHQATGTVGAILSQCNVLDSAPIGRFMNCLGGYLNWYGYYTVAMGQVAIPSMFGEFCFNNLFSDIENARLVVFFGLNPAETYMSGGSLMHDMVKTLKRKNVRVILIDPRFTDTAISAGTEWIAIRPGTDAALSAGLAHVMITENLVDETFLHEYTVGYDENSLPEGIPPGNDYKSYIMGAGTDRTPKTPEWASGITGIPARRIVQLAREIALAKPCYIAQGFSPQRHANGEHNCLGICMLSVLTGNIGVQGGSMGFHPGHPIIEFPRFPALENPVKISIPSFLWTDAVARGTELTSQKDGVRGSDRLKAPIKFIWNYAGNLLINQHSNINRTVEILKDTSKCETIVVIDTDLTSSARFADILLPHVSNIEEEDFAMSSWSSVMPYVVFSSQAIEPMFESKSIYEICRGVARRFGKEDAFTEGRTRREWAELLYAKARETYPDLPPTLDEAFTMGVYKIKQGGSPEVPLRGFREDPENHPLGTPSGKIEIFSKNLWELAKQWDLEKDDVIPALPEYVPCWEGISDPLRCKYPLQMLTSHSKARTHSIYANVKWLQKAAPQELWINPIDAEARGIQQGDDVKVFNDRGAVITKAKVTPRIMPGVTCLPEGAWYTPDPNGVDRGGCPNVLTTQRPSPLAKGNPQGTNLIEVTKA